MTACPTAWAMWLLSSSWAEEQGVFAPIYPAGSGQVEDEAAICPGIQSEVEIIKTLVNVTE
jgi:hypothetical protein